MALYRGLILKWIDGTAVGVTGRPALAGRLGVSTLFTVPVLRDMAFSVARAKAGAQGARDATPEL
jgi:hypothetical protein